MTGMNNTFDEHVVGGRRTLSLSTVRPSATLDEIVSDAKLESLLEKLQIFRR